MTELSNWSIAICAGLAFLGFLGVVVYAFRTKGDGVDQVVAATEAQAIPTAVPSMPTGPISLVPSDDGGNPNWSEPQLAVLVPRHFSDGAGLDFLSEFVRPRTYGYFMTNREMPWSECLPLPLQHAMIMLIQARMIDAKETDNPEDQRWRLTVRGATHVARLTPDPAICNAARKLL